MAACRTSATAGDAGDRILERQIAEVRRASGDAFRKGLNDVGYVDGRNVAIEYRWADGQFDRLLELATDLVRNNAAVLFAGAVDAKIKEIKAAISTTPIVFTTGGDLVELGVVASMNRPGSNATGVTVIAAELWPKQLELLRKLAGSPNLVAVLINPNNVTTRASVRDVEAAARAINQDVLIVNVGTQADFNSAFTTLVQKRAGGLLVSVDALFTNRREEIVTLAATHAVPAIYGRREFAEVKRADELRRQYHRSISPGRILRWPRTPSKVITLRFCQSCSPRSSSW